MLLQQVLQLLRGGTNQLADLLSVLEDLEGGHGRDATGLGHLL